MTLRCYFKFGLLDFIFFTQTLTAMAHIDLEERKVWKLVIGLLKTN